jgi:MYXO-CTERM domain-containing protein
MEFKPMKKSSSIVFINVGALATIVSLAIITPHAVAQTATPRTSNQDTGTATTYERNNDNVGLWGLAGLAGLFGLLGRRQEKDRSTIGRNDTPVYRDPNMR